MMNRLGVGLLALLLCVSLVAWGQSPFEAPVDGLLLLKNGRTLGGKISRSGDFYIVASAESEIQIRVHEAEAVCRDNDDVYLRKAARINPRSADDRLELAQWCIDVGLYGHAARELTEAYRIDDLHPKIPILERRLRAAMTEVKPTAPVVAQAVVKQDEAALAQVAKSISPDSLLEFTTRVQPLLVNYCATAGCHGPRPTSDFQLHRVYLHETRDARLLQANLAAVLERVDRKQPQQSKLLTAPISAHGGAKKPIFHAHNAEHYRQLVAWATRVATESTETTARTASTVENANGNLLQRMPLNPPLVATPSVEEKPATPPPAAPSATVVDPFDPEAFNRRSQQEKAEPVPAPSP
jgi:hypothetical protein